jgi:hypothetical protein
MKNWKRLILLIAITALNLADFSLTVYLIRTGIGEEANPIMRTAGIAAVKLFAVPLFAGLTFYTAALADAQGTRWVAKTVDAIILLTVSFLVVVVANNIMVLTIHVGILQLGGA